MDTVNVFVIGFGLPLVWFSVWPDRFWRPFMACLGSMMIIVSIVDALVRP